ncbi:hypothetical protein VCR31J2_1310700 [Vibrio coralliirubri]|uniref:Uncharacterized protein n=1 Tax=Vibrio coralliirubri TaxID=1516159 RepID=A0AA86WZW7_9VIBR|nr:hypothetical protein VCR31J2_1310700 [Vibrio coralliirubri]
MFWLRLAIARVRKILVQRRDLDCEKTHSKKTNKPLLKVEIRGAYRHYHHHGSECFTFLVWRECIGSN